MLVRLRRQPGLFPALLGTTCGGVCVTDRADVAFASTAMRGLVPVRAVVLSA